MWRAGPMEMEPRCSRLPVAAGACGIAHEAPEARPFSMPGLRRQNSIESGHRNQILPASALEPAGLSKLLRLKFLPSDAVPSC